MPETALLTPRETLIAAGEPAPDFTLPDQSRSDWTLSEAASSGDVLLAFYPFAFTSVCGEEMACVRDHAQDVPGATVVGGSCDSPAANAAWAERDGFTHPLLSDLHRSVCRAFGLFWAELNVANRGTVIVSKDASSPTGLAVRFSEARAPGEAMAWGAMVSRLVG